MKRKDLTPTPRDQNRRLVQQLSTAAYAPQTAAAGTTVLKDGEDIQWQEPSTDPTAPQAIPRSVREAARDVSALQKQGEDLLAELGGLDDQVAQATADLTAAKQRLATAETELVDHETRIGSAETRLQALPGELGTIGESISAAQQSAQDALKKLAGETPSTLGTRASAAQTKADQAATAAGAAQTKADTASAAAAGALTVANGKITLGPLGAALPPTTGRSTGDLCLTRDTTGKITGVLIYNSAGAWDSYTLLADKVIVPGSVGAVSIANGAVSASKVLADEALLTKILVRKLKAGEIDVESLTAVVATIIQIDAGQITSGKVQTGLLDAIEIAAAVANLVKINTSQLVVDDTAYLSKAVVDQIVASLGAYKALVVTKEMLSDDVSGALDAIEGKADSGDLSGLEARVSRVEPLREAVVVEPGVVTVTDGRKEPTQISITPGRLGFVSGGVEVAAIDSQKQMMNIDTLEIDSRIFIGHHVLEAMDNNNTIIRWWG